MAMGKKRGGDQEPLWVSGSDLPRSSGHPFYERLNGLLESGGFDELPRFRGQFVFRVQAAS